MLDFDVDVLLTNVREADTADLLDRITAYRAGMERAALFLIEEELRDRGIGPEEVEIHRKKCAAECLFYPDGVALACSYCRRPAVATGWGWHWYRFLPFIPMCPRRVRYCEDHWPDKPVSAADEATS